MSVIINVDIKEDEPLFKPYYINGYYVSKQLTSDNSGFSKWGFCEKEGKEYFIKEFLNPVYPSEFVGLAPDIVERKIAQCGEWFAEKKKLYKEIYKAQTGNLVAPIEFFRNDSHFYIVTEKVETSSSNYETILEYDLPQKMVLLKVLANCFRNLAENGVVHADVKPDNLLIKKTKNYFTIKIIDFDASYLTDSPPFGDDIQGDPVYYAPETFLAIMEEKVELTPKVDVFGLGIIFCQILSGEMPEIDEEYDYVYEAVLDGSEVKLSDKIPDSLKELIFNMLRKESSDRYSIGKVFDELCRIERGEPPETNENETPGEDIVPDKKPIPKDDRWHIVTDFD